MAADLFTATPTVHLATSRARTLTGTRAALDAAGVNLAGADWTRTLAAIAAGDRPSAGASGRYATVRAYTITAAPR